MSTRASRSARPSWLYRAALALVPAEFRRAHGAAMLQAHADLRREAINERGRLAGAIYTAREVAELARLGWTERRRTAVRPGPSTTPSRGFRIRLDGFAQDVRHAARALAAAPGFTLVAVVTLALGIGASAAVFSVVDGVLLRPMAFASPDRLVAVWETSRETGRRYRVPPGVYQDYRAETGVFEAAGVFGAAVYTLTGDGEPEQVYGVQADTGYFRTLGVSPLVGRTFSDDESVAGGPRVVVLSHGLWQRRFGARPDIVGRTLTFDGEPWEIVGVMPPGLYPSWPATVGAIGFSPAQHQFWVPFRIDPEFRSNRTAHVFGVVARLAPGVSLGQAQAAFDTVAARFAEERPDVHDGEGILVSPLADEATGAVRPALVVLLAAVGLLLVAGCANVATLSLARAQARARDLAVRSALGASRARLVVELLVESVVLAAAGGAAGVLVARLGLGALLSLVPSDVPRLDSVAIDGRVLAFAVALSALTALLFGTLPALRAARPDLQEALRQEGRSGTETPARQRTRRLLVMVEVALASVLVVGAGLLGRSFARLVSVDLGFRPDRVLVASTSRPRGEPREARAVFHRGLLERIAAVPGVESAALAYDHPLEATWTDSFSIPGRKDDEDMGAWMRTVSAGYLRTLGIDLVAGRGFDPGEDEARPGVVLVNETFARRFFPGEDPLGRRLVIPAPTRPDPPRDYEIVGIVRDVRFLGPAAPAEPAFYVHLGQFPQWDTKLLVRTSGDPLSIVGAVRTAVHGIDPLQPISEVTTLDAVASRAVAEPRFAMTLVGLFGGLAFLVAAIGIYGMLAYTVSQRTREIGVRVALGARPGDLTRLVLGQGLAVTLAGVAAGLAAAAAIARLVSSLLYGVSPFDPLTFTGAGIALVAVALVASWVPVRRATRIDPMVALRDA